jgi:ribonuclease HI
MMEVAVVAGGIAYFEDDLGHGSSAEAEWLALLHAMGVAGVLHVRDCVFVGDSLMVVRQANGDARCRGGLEVYLARFRALSVAFDRVRVRHVGRSQNLAGIALDRLRDGRVGGR